jgi:hypothetical protein
MSNYANYSTDLKSRNAAAKHINKQLMDRSYKIASDTFSASGGAKSPQNNLKLIGAIKEAKMRQHDPQGYKKMQEFDEMNKRIFYSVWAQHQRDAQQKAGIESSRRVLSGTTECTKYFSNNCSGITALGGKVQKCIPDYGGWNPPTGKQNLASVHEALKRGKFKCVSNHPTMYSHKTCHRPSDGWDTSCYEKLVTDSNSNMRPDRRSVMEQKNFEETRKKYPWFRKHIPYKAPPPPKPRSSERARAVRRGEGGIASRWNSPGRPQARDAGRTGRGRRRGPRGVKGRKKGGTH